MGRKGRPDCARIGLSLPRVASLGHCRLSYQRFRALHGELGVAILRADTSFVTIREYVSALGVELSASVRQEADVT